MERCKTRLTATCACNTQKNYTSLRVDEEKITKPDLIAESMNKYFCSAGEQLSKKIPKKMNSFISSQIPAPKSKFSFSPIEQATEGVSSKSEELC